MMTFKLQNLIFALMVLQEKHAKKPTASLDKYFTDKKSHLYTLGKLIYVRLAAVLNFNCYDVENTGIEHRQN